LFRATTVVYPAFKAPIPKDATSKAEIDTALAVIVAKINEILDKSTLSC
jgi:hypothetical protein